jgi:hypothetical protein
MNRKAGLVWHEEHESKKQSASTLTLLPGKHRRTYYLLHESLVESTFAGRKLIPNKGICYLGTKYSCKHTSCQ